MQALEELVSLLTVAEKESFKSFLAHKNTRKDVKNIQLFQSIATNDISTIKKLFGPTFNTVAYHVLRKRLVDNLLHFLAKKTFQDNRIEAYAALRLTLVAKTLLDNRLYKIAFKCLAKADGIAAELEQFSLRNEILLLKLQYAHLDVNLDLTQLSRLFLANQKQMHYEAKVNLAYAYLRQELQAIQLQGKILNLSALIKATVRRFAISLREVMSFKSLYQILYIANAYAAIQQNYSPLKRYVHYAHTFMERRTVRSPYHLYVLYYLANFSLRNRYFDRSLTYLSQLQQLIKEHKHHYGALFTERYGLLLALNQHFMGQATTALATIEKTLAAVSRKSKAEDVADLQLCRIMFLTQNNDVAAVKELGKLQHSDNWYEKNLGMLWAIRKNLLSIVVYAQNKDADLALSRCVSFRRRYKQYLRQTDEHRVLTFVALLEESIQRPYVVKDKSFLRRIETLLEKETAQDIFTLSFIAWLMALTEQASAYEIVQRLLHGSHD